MILISLKFYSNKIQDDKRRICQNFIEKLFIDGKTSLNIKTNVHIIWEFEILKQTKPHISNILFLDHRQHQVGIYSFQ